MMVATLRPLLGRSAGDGSDALAAGRGEEEPAGFGRALLLGVAFAADFGGIATPIGTGPNLIAMGAVASRHPMTFLDWMAFGVPTAALMVALTYVMLIGLHRVGGRLVGAPRPSAPLGGRGWGVVAIFFACVAGWLLEPVHGVPAGVVGLAGAGLLFATGLLGTADLRKVEWETLLLVAGGLTLGQLFEDSGLAAALARAVRWDAMGSTLAVFCLVLACASLSAVASNTAASAMLITIALGVSPSPSVAILVALGASMGVPFVISTPPNSMAYGQGGLRSRDFLVPGGILMLAGCALLAVIGPAALRWAGVP
jgi:sodium-dependent dicarboxylate transporter 2/3/5